MKIGILSDSHDNLTKLQKAVDILNEREIPEIIHAGDLVAPFTHNILGNLKGSLHVIFGNNDGESLGLKNVFPQIVKQPLELELDGLRFVVFHEPAGAKMMAKSGYADVVIYGHTHKLNIKQGRSLIINPGEICGWRYGKATMAIFDTKTKDVEIVEL